MGLTLTKEEQAMLDGEDGEGTQKAMEIVVALGTIYGADRLCAISSAQVSGVSYKNLGTAGLEFLEEWAAKGAKSRVTATLNPGGVDLTRPAALGFPEEFTRNQLRVIDAFRKMGILLTCSCTPYLIGNDPKLGEHCAWGESSAIIYANSVLGARTNREGGPSALAAAVTGRTADCGYHLDENRKATLLVDVRDELADESDYGALGLAVGKLAGKGVPWIRGIRPSRDDLKTLGAAMAAAGGVALYHVEGVTPEARGRAPESLETTAIESLDDVYAQMNGTAEEIDLVSIGCPHASLDEIARVAGVVRGQRLRTRLWISTAGITRALADKQGWVRDIEAAGGTVIQDTCHIVAPIKDMGIRTMATNSGKGAWYAPSHAGQNVRFGSLDQCLEAALTGRWPERRKGSRRRTVPPPPVDGIAGG